MKSLIVFGLIYMLLLPLLAIGCDRPAASAEDATATTSAEGKVIEVTLDDFAANKNMVREIEIAKSGTLTVKLGSNASTGYQWGDPEISDTGVISQTSEKFLEPDNTAVVGAAGTDVRTFTAAKAGTATIKLSYSRPWEGGEQDEYTLTVNVIIK